MKDCRNELRNLNIKLANVAFNRLEQITINCLSTPTTGALLTNAKQRSLTTNALINQSEEIFQPIYIYTRGIRGRLKNGMLLKDVILP